MLCTSEKPACGQRDIIPLFLNRRELAKNDHLARIDQPLPADEAVSGF
jgi:hypothetical protein